MNPSESVDVLSAHANEHAEDVAADLVNPGKLLRDLVRVPSRVSHEVQEPRSGFPIVGTLIALEEGGNVALVATTAEPGRVLRARTVLDLRASHIGANAVLMFEELDSNRPIVMGLLTGRAGWPLEDVPAGQVEVQGDGRRMVVMAHDELVMRCGKASITLTRAGKVLIKGSYVVSEAEGVNRLSGGTVQLN